MADEISGRVEEQIRVLAMHRMKRMTFEECARAMKASISTLKRWAARPEFTRIWRETETEWREAAQADVYNAGKLAVETMVLLMQSAKSDFVRVQAAKAVGDWAGLGQTTDDNSKDDREELLAALAAIQHRQLAVIQQTKALPAGDIVEGQLVGTEELG